MQLSKLVQYTPEKTSLIIESTDTSGALFLGNISSLMKSYKKYQIKGAISICEFSEFDNIQLDNHLVINIDDSENENILQYFQQTNQFIEENLKKGNVLVHCMAGVSRSATIIIAYIMWNQKISFQNAFNFVSQLRVIYPNSGFKKQLQEYENQLKQEVQ